MREVKGNMEITGLVPGDTPFVEDGLDEGKQFARDAAKKKGQDLGTSAHVRICLKALESMSKMSIFKDNPEFMEALKAFWEVKVSKLDPQELKNEVQIFRITKPKTMSQSSVDDLGAYAKVAFRFKPATISCSVAERLQEAMIKVFKEQKWHMKYGAAPRSAKERKLRSMLSQLQGN